MSMLHEISPLSPRYKKTQRKGRGESSGRGKTSGRGTKGAKARVGTTFKRGHEHGQTPIFRRLPKRGFSNFEFENRFYVVNLSDIEANYENGDTVDSLTLAERGLVPDSKLPVKILGDGKLTKKLTFVAGWYSKSAHKSITDLGGVANNTKGEAFAFPKVKKKFVKRLPEKKGKAGAETEATVAPAAPAPAAAAPAPTTEAKPE